MDENKYKKIMGYLDRCVQRDCLSHAYVFYGPDKNSAGKAAFWLADKILQNEKNKFHPDLLSIRPESNKEMPIELVRQIKNFLSFKPYSGAKRIVIIEDAEKLSAYAQDALLKTLEEMPDRSLMVLCAKSLGLISDTIVSRAVKLPFWRVDSNLTPRSKIFFEIFKDLTKSDTAKKYSLVEKLSHYDPAEVFKKLMEFLRERFLNEPTKKAGELLKNNMRMFFKLSESNANPKFIYDELILLLCRF